MKLSSARLRSQLVVFGGCVFLLAGLATTWILFSGHGSPRAELPDLSVEAGTAADGQRSTHALSADEQLRRSLAGASSDAEKARLIEAVAATGVSLGQVPYLRSCMTMEESETVRGAAFRAALQLSKRGGELEGRNLLMDTIQNPYADVRRQALRECKGLRDPELISLLVDTADSRASDRFLVVDALATMEDDKARARVLAAAKDTKLPRAERLRAVALLSKTRTEDAKEYLIELASADDLELQRLAIEVLNATQAAERK